MANKKNSTKSFSSNQLVENLVDDKTLQSKSCESNQPTNKHIDNNTTNQSLMITNKILSQAKYKEEPLDMLPFAMLCHVSHTFSSTPFIFIIF